jgi:hypothetical protein
MRTNDKAMATMIRRTQQSVAQRKLATETAEQREHRLAVATLEGARKVAVADWVAACKAGVHSYITERMRNNILDIDAKLRARGVTVCDYSHGVAI